jgi:hypothetical protein
MGNHAAGAMIVTTVEAMADRRRPGESAMDILDAALAKVKASPGFSTDAEFDDAAQPETPFGQVITEAFGTPGKVYDDPEGDDWYDDVYAPFAQRFGLT